MALGHLQPSISEATGEATMRATVGTNSSKDHRHWTVRVSLAQGSLPGSKNSKKCVMMMAMRQNNAEEVADCLKIAPRCRPDGDKLASK